MSDHCCAPPAPPQAADQPPDHVYRRALWVALGLNVAMFGIEIFAGAAADSLSLLADALDFFGDSCNYAVGLYLLTATVQRRARVALLKASIMGLFAMTILGLGLWRFVAHTPPVYATMGIVGLLALAANIAAALVLLRFKHGDSNRRGIWLCTRNDAIGNVLVVLAAGGVYYTGSGVPDLAAAGIMAGLGLAAAWQIARQARQELAAP
jgi:Co/Zn/Cd efflux system component